jgi:hypothetical protein
MRSRDSGGGIRLHAELGSFVTPPPPPCVAEPYLGAERVHLAEDGAAGEARQLRQRLQLLPGMGEGAGRGSQRGGEEVCCVCRV